MKTHGLSSVAATLAVGAAFTGTAFAATGPSSSQSPYIERSQPGVTTTSILTAGDSVGGYRMVGIPDGLGAWDNGDGTFTLLSNHELSNNKGVARAHGGIGAFVSRWVIDKDTLAVESGQDQIQHLITSGSQNLNRLCSADLPDYTAFYNPTSGKGFDGRIFMSGEETGGGRPFGHVVTGAENGNSYDLSASFGTGEWENLLANPATGDKTVVIGLNDATPGELVVYAGDKQTTGNAVQQAGLTNGSAQVIKVNGVGVEDSATGIPSGTRFGLAARGTGTGFLRPEDGSWDPSDPRNFYFVTTNAFNAQTRLWRLRFDDPANPAAGGTIDQMIDGSEATNEHMFDNITVTDRGQVLIQEDPGNNAYVARIWRYYPATDKLEEIAHHDLDRFQPGGSAFVTQDEESSGIIDASSVLGEGKFLLDVQSHKASSDPEIVEDGQYLRLTLPSGRK